MAAAKAAKICKIKNQILIAAGFPLEKFPKAVKM